MKIIAHRGASSEFPENTLRAFRRAVEIGVDEIETDLVETRDGIIVLHHDETLLCGAKTIPIRSLAWAEVQKIKKEIPSLDEVLEELGGQVPFCLELKTAGLAERTAALIQKYGLDSETHFTSFQTAEIVEIKKLCPGAAFSWTFSKLPEGIEEVLKREGMEAVSLSLESVSQGIVERLCRQGIKTRVYTVNDPVFAERCAAWGVDAIFTDDPARMQGFRKS
ncbi:MAG: glycerophosphodiester phosphodiesterase [Candidatus Omnitrophica bacterium]|nr:glycerophosphodiester phosphodiesterase [Candidatus Omnitrophota bacterium]